MVRRLRRQSSRRGSEPSKRRERGPTGTGSPPCYASTTAATTLRGREKPVLIACSTASFPQESLESAIRRIAWAGFGAVELDLRAAEPPDPWQLRSRLHDEGMEVAAIHCGSAPATGGEAALPEWARLGRIASLARELDCAHIVIAAPETGELAALREGLGLLDKALGDLPVEV